MLWGEVQMPALERLAHFSSRVSGAPTSSRPSGPVSRCVDNQIVLFLRNCYRFRESVGPMVRLLLSANRVCVRRPRPEAARGRGEIQTVGRRKLLGRIEATLWPPHQALSWQAPATSSDTRIWNPKRGPSPCVFLAGVVVNAPSL